MALEIGTCVGFKSWAMEVLSLITVSLCWDLRFLVFLPEIQISTIVRGRKGQTEAGIFSSILSSHILNE